MREELVYSLAMESILTSKMTLNLDFLSSGVYELVFFEGENRVSTRLNKI